MDPLYYGESDNMKWIDWDTSEYLDELFWDAQLCHNHMDIHLNELIDV